MARTPEAVIALVIAFDVRNNPLFWPGTLLDTVEASLLQENVAIVNGKRFKLIKYTRCNGYAGVFFGAMGCPIPVGMTANQLFVWFFDQNGKASGWRECSLLEAIGRANGGYPVAIVAEDQPHGHIGVGVPNKDDLTQLYCTAAGASNTQKQSVALQFGKLAGRAKYATHD